MTVSRYYAKCMTRFAFVMLTVSLIPSTLLAMAILGLGLPRTVCDVLVDIGFWPHVCFLVLSLFVPRRLGVRPMYASSLVSAFVVTGGLFITIVGQVYCAPRSSTDAIAMVFIPFVSAMLFGVSLILHKVTTGIVNLSVAEGPPGCPTCDYDLTGNVSGRCPECGTPVTREDIG